MSVENSNGVNGSDGVNRSHGINRSYGVNLSNGVNWSNGINRSYGINLSYGVNRSYDVSNHIFCYKKERTFKLFNTEISEDRFNNVLSEIHRLNNGWHPNFNNAFELYVGAGKDWEKVKSSDICSNNADDDGHAAWEDMPQATIDYIRSLPEYDADIFHGVTGLNKETKQSVTIELTESQIESLKKQGIL